jgi:hypothetical protein
MPLTANDISIKTVLKMHHAQHQVNGSEGFDPATMLLPLYLYIYSDECKWPCLTKDMVYCQILWSMHLGWRLSQPTRFSLGCHQVQVNLDPKQCCPLQFPLEISICQDTSKVHSNKAKKKRYICDSFVTKRTRDLTL